MYILKDLIRPKLHAAATYCMATRIFFNWGVEVGAKKPAEWE